MFADLPCPLLILCKDIQKNITMIMAMLYAYVLHWQYFFGWIGLRSFICRFIFQVTKLCHARIFK